MRNHRKYSIAGTKKKQPKTTSQDVVPLYLAKGSIEIPRQANKADQMIHQGHQVSNPKTIFIDGSKSVIAASGALQSSVETSEVLGQG
jgi:hypothetical protein